MNDELIDIYNEDANKSNYDNLTSLQKETLKQLEYDQVLEKIARYCISIPGKEIIFDTYPIENIQLIIDEHNLIEETMQVVIMEDEIPLGGLNDNREQLQRAKIQNSILSPIEILKISDTIRVFRLLKSFFRNRDEAYPLLNSSLSRLFENRLLEKHIIDAIDDTGIIRDNATADLASIRARLHEKSMRLRSRLRKILRKVSDDDIVTEDFYSIREGRFVLPIKANYKRKVNGIIHGISQTGQTVFLEPAEIIETNNEISLLRSEEEREIYKILLNLTAEIGHQANDILTSIQIIAHFDSLLARGRYGFEFGGIKPLISDRNEIEMQNIRHPLLVHQKGKKYVIPLTIDFNTSKRGHLISGPNAGGKTVALKSMGLNLSMALAGIFPLGECRTNYRNIYSSIGDRQSIENDLSTFSSQILQLKQILDECNNYSLVLVDEIGSGTDPQEGAALACGILDTFVNLNLFFVATTHQSSLKTYALNRDEIANASLEFDLEKLVPTYKFLQGVPGNSYAFFLAKNVGLSKSLLKKSRTYLGNKQQQLEESISILSRYKQEAKELKNTLSKEKLLAEKTKKKYEERIAKATDKRQEILDKAKNEAVEIVFGANALIEKTIKDIREDKKTLADIKQEYSKKKEIIENKINKPTNIENNKINKEIEILIVGDAVTMDDSTSAGLIISMSDNGKTALVEFGGLKFNVKTNKLNKTKQKELHKNLSNNEKSTTSRIDVSFDVVNKLDIRGERAESALRKLDEFLSDAIISNLSQVSIVHGKGTGALRVAVHEDLKHHPTIQKFRLGTLTEGGDGITIVEL